MRQFLRLAAGALAVLFVTPLHAQQTASIFVQATLGIGTSAGGDYVERDENTAEVMLGGRAPKRTGPIAFGMALGGNFVYGSDLTCRVGSNGGCVPGMPRFGYVALLTGLDAHGRAGGIDVMAGPALLMASSATRIGAQARVDLTSPSVLHLSIVASPRLLLVPNLAGATLTLRSFSIGLRLR